MNHGRTQCSVQQIEAGLVLSGRIRRNAEQIGLDAQPRRRSDAASVITAVDAIGTLYENPIVTVREVVENEITG